MANTTHEPSYYEIALTNRQVVVAFVILLLCLVAAFFSGVWIGRENGVRTAEQMVRNTPPPEPEQKEGQNLEELEFFGSEQPQGTPAQSPDTPAVQPAAQEPETESTTLAEDFGAEGAEGEGGEEPAFEEIDEAPPVKAEREPRPAPSFPEDATARETARETPRQEPAPARPSEAAPREPARPAPTAAAGRMVIQVFSSSEKDQAERIRARLVGGGQKAYLSPVEVSGRTMYRVRIGPFDSRDQAQKVAEQVRKGFKLDTWITEE